MYIYLYTYTEREEGREGGESKGTSEYPKHFRILQVERCYRNILSLLLSSIVQYC